MFVFVLLSYLEQMIKDSKRKLEALFMRKPVFSENALANVNRGLQDMKRLHREIKINLQAIENRHQTIQKYSSDAWGEREQLLLNYFDTIRAILLTIDNYADYLNKAPITANVFDNLKELLAKQCIEPIQVREGDPFNAEFHKCQHTVERDDYLTGVIVQVIETGYIKKYNNGANIVIRPTLVIANIRNNHGNPIGSEY